MQEDVFAAVARAFERGERAALVTVTATQGSTPQRVGAKMLVYEDGRTVGTVGGGATEHEAAAKALACLRARQAAAVSFDLNHAPSDGCGPICGGRMDVFIEPLDPAPHLHIAGAGHVGQQVASLAAAAGFRVHVVDDREAFANRDRFPSAAAVDVADIAPHLAAAEIPPSGYVLVVTRGHQHDLEAMRALAGRPLKYVGMIGSRAKVAHVMAALAAEGVSKAWLDAVHAPVGLRIGAVTPEEIAVSIVAELVAVRRGAAADVPGGPASMQAS